MRLSIPHTGAYSCVHEVVGFGTHSLEISCIVTNVMKHDTTIVMIKAQKNILIHSMIIRRIYYVPIRVFHCFKLIQIYCLVLFLPFFCALFFLLCATCSLFCALFFLFCAVFALFCAVFALFALFALYGLPNTKQSIQIFK